MPVPWHVFIPSSFPLRPRDAREAAKLYARPERAALSAGNEKLLLWNLDWLTLHDLILHCLLIT